MKAVGVKDLKARLSQYLREVKAGEIVLVTDRSEVVAELRPARQSSAQPASDRNEVLQEMAARGELTRARMAKTKGWTWNPKGLGLPAGAAQEILDDLRKDAVLP